MGAKRFSQETINNSPVISKLTLHPGSANTPGNYRETLETAKREDLETAMKKSRETEKQ